MPLETDAQYLKRAVDAKLVDPEKGSAAMSVYSQLKTMGARFPFGQFLVDRGLITPLARFALDSRRDISVFANIGDFEIVDVLGEGQCATVFRAKQRSLDRMVALKILNADFAADPANVRRFQGEARATARFSHPNIVQGFVTGSAHGLHFFAMEYIDGGTARVITEASETGLDEPLALEIVRQAAEGLRAAHAAGFVHRDVKPDNILLTHDGQAKLADLGISQAVRNAGDEGVFWASPPYVAPEVIQGLPADSRSDIYSLGATLYELLTAKPPYHADTPHEILNLHLTAPVPDMRGLRSDVSQETSILVQHMLVKQPDFRVQTAAAVIEAVQKILMPSTAPKPRAHANAVPMKAVPVARSIGHGPQGPQTFHGPKTARHPVAMRPFPAVPPVPSTPVRPSPLPRPQPLPPPVANPEPKQAAKPRKPLRRRRYRPRR